ncbi:MAG: glycerophosphodiester phosphodiesterase family protein [Pseudomonadota bacterium]
MQGPPFGPPLDPAFLTTPIAHRALHDRAAGVIENSRAAVAAAVEAGFGIEIDLQLSADGEAMVFHDDELNRLTGERGPVRERTAIELRRIDLDGADDGIPTLAEVLDIVRGSVPLLIEAKDQSLSLTEVDGRLERRAARLLSAYDGPVGLMSFNPHSVAHFRDAAPDIPRGRVTCGFGETYWSHVAPDRRAELARIDDLETLGASFISHQRSQIDEVAALKAAGWPVLTWTVRSPEEETEVRRIADNVTFEGYRPQ